jgi:hypothetical protein
VNFRFLANDVLDTKEAGATINNSATNNTRASN